MNKTPNQAVQRFPFYGLAVLSLMRRSSRLLLLSMLMLGAGCVTETRMRFSGEEGTWFTGQYELEDRYVDIKGRVPMTVKSHGPRLLSFEFAKREPEATLRLDVYEGDDHVISAHLPPGTKRVRGSKQNGWQVLIDP